MRGIDRPDGRLPTGEAGIRVLVADDNDAARSLFGMLLLQAKGVSSVLEAVDGADAVRIGQQCQIHVAVLDLTMPRLDGVEAAVQLAALSTSMRIALHSSDPETLRERAKGLGLPLFDKLEFDDLVEWVERQAGWWRARGARVRAPRTTPLPEIALSCLLCGYGIAGSGRPARCPMCQAEAVWTPWPLRPSPKGATRP